MQSLGVSLAKRVNARLGRRGHVLQERYHVHILKTPREVKNALSYVLSNSYNHAGRRGRIALDAFSSAITVADSAWRALLGREWRRVVGFPEGFEPSETRALGEKVSALLCPPGTWLLNVGWARVAR
jgi:hypothetical protein